LKEGCGVLSIPRIIGISKNTVLSRMLKLSKQITASDLSKFGYKYELDEMWTFIKMKEDFTWITYAIERDSKNVVGFLIGSKSKANIRPLVEEILLLSP
tara:strand:- start:290652 stop:290948 length:297 start_codon:yes stop_codon:yes gene_type:complete